jgi:hypothetical protein
MFRSLIRLIFYVAGPNSLFALALPNALAQTAPTLTVDAAGNPHPINPDIYGIASYSLDAGFAKEIQVPNVRWGGDATTRYNWEVDSSNAGFDWYFMGGQRTNTHPAIYILCEALIIRSYPSKARQENQSRVCFRPLRPQRL